jgi:hypothetical protein
MYFTRFTLLFVLLLLGVVGCGYKPSAKYSRGIVGEKIHTSVVISAQDPENTVIIKDAIDAAIIEIFHASLTDVNHADTKLTLSISNPSYAPIQYNADGFVVAYRATIRINIVRDTDLVHKRYATKGTYDFSVVPNAVLSDQERFDAIKYSATKAMASFIAKISAEGSRKP